MTRSSKRIGDKELMIITGLAEGNLRFLHTYDLLDRKPYPESYSLSELIYCGLMYYVIAYIGLTYLRTTMRHHCIYGDLLTYKKYALIVISRDTYLPLILGDDVENLDQEARLIVNPVCFEKMSIVDQYQGEIEIEKYFFNLEKIRKRASLPQ